MIKNRPDALLVKNLSNMRKLLPFMMQKRNESIVFFEQNILVDETLKFINNYNLNNTEKISFFHLVIAAFNRALSLRPKMNRYILGNKTYQRENFLLSFAVKPKMLDSHEIRAVKINIEHHETLHEIVSKINNIISGGRQDILTTAERETDFILKLPKFLIPVMFWLQKKLDNLNLLPTFMTKHDPLYASIFLANLGSIGLEAPFHHLYEYGGVSIFAGFGQIKQVPIVNKQGEIVVAKTVTFRYSFDERIADGFYCARSLRIFERLLSNPEALLEPKTKSARSAELLS